MLIAGDIQGFNSESMSVMCIRNCRDSWSVDDLDGLIFHNNIMGSRLVDDKQLER